MQSVESKWDDSWLESADHSMSEVWNHVLDLYVAEGMNERLALAGAMVYGDTILSSDFSVWLEILMVWFPSK